jgi:hypothetical protein
MPTTTMVARIGTVGDDRRFGGRLTTVYTLVVENSDGGGLITYEHMDGFPDRVLMVAEGGAVVDPDWVAGGHRTRSWRTSRRRCWRCISTGSGRTPPPMTSATSTSS